MISGSIWKIIAGVLITVLILPGRIMANSDMTADTSELISMAKEIRHLANSHSFQEADSLLKAAFQSVDSRKIKTPQLLIWVRAEYEFRKQDYNAANKSAMEAFNSPQQQLGPRSLGELAVFYAKTCQYTGQFNTAIDILENTIEFAKAKHLEQLLPITYLGLANVYKVGEKPEKEQEALELMLQKADEEHDLKHAQIAANRLGLLRLSYNRDLVLTNKYLQRSLDLTKQLGDSVLIAHAYSNLGWNLYLGNKLDSSLIYYKNSLSYSLPTKQYSKTANSYGNIGTIFRELKEYDQALEAWKIAIENAEIVNDWFSLSWIYNDMSLMAASRGDYQNAYDFQLKFKQFSDSVLNKNNTDGFILARAKFAADMDKNELQLLSLQLKNQKLLIYGFGGFLVLSVIIGLLLLRQSRLNARRRISEMDQKILEVTQANLRQQMNPHFIFNTLNSIQYYMYKHDKLATNNYLTKFSTLMRRILENSQHTAIPIRNELDALQLYLELESIRFKDKFDYEIQMDEEIDPLLYKIPTMLIQPYVENAIVHGLMYRDGKGKVKINLTLQSNFLVCEIEDNGIGRDASREFSRKKEHHSLGTHITESRLKLVNSLYGTSLKTIYTDLKDDLGNATGTRVEIHIPILT